MHLDIPLGPIFSIPLILVSAVLEGTGEGVRYSYAQQSIRDWILATRDTPLAYIPPTESELELERIFQIEVGSQLLSQYRIETYVTRLVRDIFTRVLLRFNEVYTDTP